MRSSRRLKPACMTVRAVLAEPHEAGATVGRIGGPLDEALVLQLLDLPAHGRGVQLELVARSDTRMPSGWWRSTLASGKHDGSTWSSRCRVRSRRPACISSETTASSADAGSDDVSGRPSRH